jgi:feruloyl esterase
MRLVARHSTLAGFFSSGLLLLTVATLIAARGDAAGTPCVNLAALTIPGVAIQSAASIAAGPLTLPGLRPMDLPAFCRVIAAATPTADSVINFEVWIPTAQAWNGKFQGVGNSGFLGSIAYDDMAVALRRGYASASTDTGHVGGDLKFGDGHPEKIVDWAYRAIHVMTQTAQLIVRDHTGRFAQYSYFDGCNTGGHQALMEAQRYPNDYDGIIAGDPAADRVHEVVGYLSAWIATHKDGASLLSPAKLQFVTTAAVAACDALDGVKDQVIEDPRRCHFDPATLACRNRQTTDCLTPSEIAAFKKVYDGARNPRTGQLIFRGWSPGSEGFGETSNQGWSNFINIPEPRRVDFLKYFVFHNPNWDWNSMDWDRDVAYADATIGFVDATARDLGDFRSRRGKLLMYTGWDDPILPPLDIVDYYESVARTMGGLAKTSEFFRLFMVPGMGHCNGGPGTTNFDMLPALEQWVEKQITPERVVAARQSKGVTERTRPLCPYPSVAKWKGNGSTDEAANFACVVQPAQ